MSRTEPARGMRDYLPEDIRRREYVIGVIRRVYERYGFEPLETPAVENLETLMGKYGEEGNQLIFKILKRGEHEASGQADLALRYDLTVPLSRVVAHLSEQAAAALQALSDSAGVARGSSGARALPRVLSVRRGRARLDVAGDRSRSLRGGV
jgi:histidyl-tRNA synthetase